MKKLTQILLIFSFIVGGFLSPLQVDLQTNQVSVQQVHAADNEFIKSTVIANCDWGFVACGVGNFFLWYFELIWYKTTQIIAFIVAFGLDVLLFHSISSATYRTGIIEAGWEVLRNLVNIVFIFSLLTIAFKMVLGGSSSQTKAVLIKTIIVALVINFSLFLSYLIIDASNILANVFYTRIETEGPKGSGDGDLFQKFFTGQTFVSPSSAIVNNFQPQTIVNNVSGAYPNFFTRWMIIFAAGGLNILMVIMFTSIVLLFLGRTVGLIFSAILAPLAFATLTIPFGNATSLPYIGFNTWLKQLVSLAFMAPVYLFFLYLIITFANNEALFNAIALQSSSGVLGNILAVFIPFAVIATLIITAKRVTKTMAGELGGQISAGLSKVATGAVAAAAITATGGAAMAGGALRGVGTLGAKIGLVGEGNRAQTLGKQLQTTKFNITKIPGFDSIAGDSKIGNKIAGKIGGGLSNSYADLDIKARTGANALRGKYSDFVTNKTPEAVENWDKKVQESRNNLIGRKIENKQRQDIDRTKMDSTNKDARILTGYDPTTKVKSYSKDMNGMTFEEALNAKYATLAKRTAAEAKQEKDRVEKEQKEVQFNIDQEQDQIKTLNSQKKGASASEQARIEGEIRQKREKIEKLKKEKKTIESTTLEGQINQLKKLIDNQKAQSRSNVLDKTGGRYAKQVENVGKGDIKTTPKVGGDPKEDSK